MTKQRIPVFLAAATLIAVLFWWQFDTRHSADGSASANAIHETDGAAGPLISSFSHGETPPIPAQEQDPLAAVRALDSADPTRDPRKSNEFLWWPQPPSMMESTISNWISQRWPGILTMDSISCDEIECRTEYTATGGLPSSEAFFNDLSAIGIATFATEKLEEMPGGIKWAVRFQSYGEYGGKPQRTAEELSLFAGPSPGSSLNFRPTIVGTYQGMEVVQSRICPYDCPRNTHNIVSLVVPDGVACQDVGGVETTMQTESETGLKTFMACVPTVLVEQIDE